MSFYTMNDAGPSFGRQLPNRVTSSVPKPIHAPSSRVKLASQETDSHSPQGDANQQNPQPQHRLPLMHQNRILQQQQALHHIPRLPHQHSSPFYQPYNRVHHLPNLPQHQLVASLGVVPRLPPFLSADEHHFRQMQLRRMGNPQPASQTLLDSVNYNKPQASATKTEATGGLEKAELDVLEQSRKPAKAQERAKKEAEALAKAEAAMAKARELPHTTMVLLKQSASGTAMNSLKRSSPSASNSPSSKKRERPFASILYDLDNSFSSSIQSDEKKTSDDSRTIKDDAKLSRVGTGASSSSQLPSGRPGLLSKEMMDVFAKTAAAAIALKSDDRESTNSGRDTTSNVGVSTTSSPTLEPPPTAGKLANLEVSATSEVGSKTLPVSTSLQTSAHVVTNSELEAARKIMKIPGTIVQTTRGSTQGHWELVHPEEFQQNTELVKILPEVVSKSSGLSHDSYKTLSKQLTPPKNLRVPEVWDINEDPLYFVVDPTKSGESSLPSSSKTIDPASS